jgi:hypothetical protein
MSQLAGARRAESVEGNERGANLIEVWNSSGFCLTLLPGRCLDIAYAHYKGQALCFRGNTGDVGPAFYEPEGYAWMRGFFGGLLTTCGLTFVGHPETDPEEENMELGLHGRLSFIPAKRVVVDEGWEGENYLVRIRGRMREAVVSGTNLELSREISIQLGEKRFTIRDRVENLSRNKRSPLMIVYHTNPGFPLLDEGTRLVVASRRTVEWIEGREVGPEAYTVVGPLRRDDHDDVYIHDPIVDSSGYVNVALINDHLSGGLGLYWKFKKSEIPVLNQWQHFVAGTYVTGIEPGNCSVLGRKSNREAGTLQYIAPGEVREFTLEMGVLEGQEEIGGFEEKVRGGM